MRLTPKLHQAVRQSLRSSQGLRGRRSVAVSRNYTTVSRLHTAMGGRVPTGRRCHGFGFFGARGSVLTLYRLDENCSSTKIDRTGERTALGLFVKKERKLRSKLASAIQFLLQSDCVRVLLKTDSSTASSVWNLVYIVVAVIYWFGQTCRRHAKINRDGGRAVCPALFFCWYD